MSRGHTIIAVVGILVIIALAIALTVVIMFKGLKEEHDICLTPGCFNTSLGILHDMNPHINPCDNFYEFACGGYLANAVVPDGSISIDHFAEITAEIEKRLKTVIEEPSKPDEPRPFTLAKNYFRACMNTSQTDKAGLEPLLNILRQFGGWPVIDGNNWNGERFSWIESVYKSRELGYPTATLISVTVSADWKNSSKYTLVLDQPELGLGRDYLIEGFESVDVQIHYNYTVDIAVLLGADRQRATQELKESLEFEIKLAEISLPEEDRRNYTLLHNPMSVAELSEKYPSVNWEEYLNKLLAPIIHVDADEIVTVNVPNFISDIEKLFKETPKRVLANYIGWRVVQESAYYMTKNIRERTSKYNADMNQVELTNDPRWKECLSIVSDSSLSLSINALYVRKYFNEKARRMAVEMVEDIRNELIKILKESDWMDGKTKSKALEKARAMFSHVAYPIELLDDKKLENLLAPLVVNTNDFLGVYRNLSRFDFNFVIARLREPVNKTEWFTHEESTLVNAAYGPTDNSVQIPAGILQGVFFGDDRPQYMNYGAIGFLIGHEMTHSFDNEGRQFDKDGNVVDWWTAETAHKYLEKAQCIIEQYNDYTVPAVGANVDGDITQGENIADNGGIKEAYFAYQDYVKRNGPEQKLPGLDYTPDQMFWLSFANLWCSRFAPESANYELTTDVHSPDRFRVIGALSNMPQFAADFNCPLGSPMNPEHKCSVI